MSTMLPTTRQNDSNSILKREGGCVGDYRIQKAVACSKENSITSCSFSLSLSLLKMLPMKPQLIFRMETKSEEMSIPHWKQINMKVSQI